MSPNRHGFVWLASYPKSGNTWLRLFLENLLADGDRPCDINHLPHIGHAPTLEGFALHAGIDPTLLSHDEMDRLRPGFYAYLLDHGYPRRLLKTHDAYRLTSTGEPLFPPGITRGAIYLIRNPLDVCVSYRHHKGLDSYDQVVALMANRDYALCDADDGPSTQMRQKLSSWSGHVESWTGVRDFPVLTLRYEDLAADPMRHFSRAVAFLGLDHDADAIRRAIDFSAFDELRKQEQAAGFGEKPNHTARFFRAGKTGDWRDQLTPAQVARIVADHGATMARFGYLEEAMAFILNPTEPQGTKGYSTGRDKRGHGRTSNEQQAYPEPDTGVFGVIAADKDAEIAAFSEAVQGVSHDQLAVRAQGTGRMFRQFEIADQYLGHQPSIKKILA